jgi:phenylacetate-CoA ligase
MKFYRMSVANYINETVLLPISDFVFGRNIARDLIFLKKSQWFSASQLESYQNEKLQIMIHYVYNNIPYYKDLFNNLKIKPTDIQTKNDMHKLPVLTKSIIKKEGIERFTSSAVPERKMIKSSSSGSTGEPLFYYISKEAYSMNIAASLRGWYWTGYRLGDKFVKLSQSPRESLIKSLQDRITNDFFLTTNPLTDDNFKNILIEIEKFRPKIIRCYPDPLLFLARYKKDHPEFSFKPDAITTTGNTLFPETRKEIEDAFKCKIFDAYNCEGNSVVFECPTHTCYHSTEEYGISEILNENGGSIKKGIGRLISTDLHNFAHPFIRYDTQDFVEVDDSDCVCGRKHLKIIKILGRDNDIITNRTGRKFIVHNFTGFFQTDSKEINRSIDQFQIVKMKDDSIWFRLVVNDNYNPSVEEYIRNYWEIQFQQPIKVELLNEIPLTASGKRRFIINEHP